MHVFQLPAVSLPGRWLLLASMPVTSYFLRTAGASSQVGCVMLLVCSSAALTACSSIAGSPAAGSSTERLPIGGNGSPDVAERKFGDKQWLQEAAELTSAKVVDAAERETALVAPVTTLDIDVVDAPLSAVLHASAKQVGLDLLLGGKGSQRITLRATGLTPAQLLERLARQVPLTHTLDKDVLQVWIDTSYTDSYALDYLNIERQTRSSVGLATRVGRSSEFADANGGISNQSEARVQNLADHRFWQSLQDNIDTLFEDSDSVAKVAINREAGLITLTGHVSVHQILKRYLDRLQTSATRQVLIEATVVEVSLDDSFAAGVDWQVLASGVDGVSALQRFSGLPSVASDVVDRITSPAGLISWVQRSGYGDINVTLNLLEQMGDVRILSRPRIMALNNQPSILKVVDNRVYFTVNVQRQRSEERDDIITETEIHTVPVGLVMQVTPFISETDQVMLNVRPTISRILGFVKDPNPELALARVQNTVPEIQVREMESMLRVASGDVAVIGGLIQETATDANTRVPWVGRLPLLGKFFQQSRRARKSSELVVVLRPTVVPVAPSALGN